MPAESRTLMACPLAPSGRPHLRFSQPSPPSLPTPCGRQFRLVEAVLTTGGIRVGIGRTNVMCSVASALDGVRGKQRHLSLPVLASPTEVPFLQMYCPSRSALMGTDEKVDAATPHSRPSRQTEPLCGGYSTHVPHARGHRLDTGTLQLYGAVAGQPTGSCQVGHGGGVRIQFFQPHSADGCFPDRAETDVTHCTANLHNSRICICSAFYNI